MFEPPRRIETVRPFGFLLVSAYTSADQVPERIISPLEVVEVLEQAHRDTRVRLANGEILRLWMCPAREFASMLDEAMRERRELASDPNR